LPISLTTGYPRQISDDIRTAREIVGLEIAHRGEREAGHDIGRGELIACEILRIACPRVKEVEGSVDPRSGAKQDLIVISELEPVQSISRPMPACSVPFAK
jgi:hypothetical protein